MAENFYIDVDIRQKNHENERICGDVFLSRKIKEENRVIAVLSDGLGSGVKANILATLTATMAVNFTQEHKEANKIAEIIMNTLPVCSERKISYSTFTIVDISADGKVNILEYDNPSCIIFRGNQLFHPPWNDIILESKKNAGKEIRTSTFYAQKEDRIIICSDGITQSGLGNGKYLLGWGVDNLTGFLKETITSQPEISAGKLAASVVNKAYINDDYSSKDDSSCSVIYFRKPRKLLLCTGPPFKKEKDFELAKIVNDFDGKIILSGATTSDIISRELNRKIIDSFKFDDPDLPPISFMDGVDLITEGILTLAKVSEILKTYSNDYLLSKGPADRIVKLLLESDKIKFVIGTRINVAHQDPNLPVELEIRRTVVKRIVETLEKKYLKEVEIEYL